VVGLFFFSQLVSFPPVGVLIVYVPSEFALFVFLFTVSPISATVLIIFFVLDLQYGTESVEPLVSEEKVMFGIHGHAKSVLTLAKIRKHFRKSDTRAVAKEVLLDQSLLGAKIS